VAALSSVAHAEPKAQLTYVREPGAEACPDESDVRKAVAQRLGYDPFGEHPLSTVAVTVGKSARGLRARIELTDAAGEPSGSRELTSLEANCLELAWAVELAISLAIDPLHFADAPPPSVAPARAAPAPSAEVKVATPPVAAPPAPAVTRVLEPKRRYRLGAGAFAVLGSSPSVAFGFRATAGVRARLWSMNLEARADIPAAAPAAGGTVATGVYAGALVPCFHQLMFAGCGLVVLGAHHAIGTGYPNANDPWAFYAALGVRAAIEVKLHERLELQIAADLLAPLTRIKLQLDGIDTVFETPAVSGAFHLALAGYFK